MTEIPIPQCVTDTLKQLNQLAEQYQKSIPVSAAADFLGMDYRSLESYLMGPYNPVGIRKNDKSGAFLVTHTRDKQCKISSILFLKKSISLKDKTRFAAQGGDGAIEFSYR